MFAAIMTENFLTLMVDTKLELQETWNSKKDK